MAKALVGATNPSGKLPVTFYAGTDQLPPFDDYDMRGGAGRTFRFLDRVLAPKAAQMGAPEQDRM